MKKLIAGAVVALALPVATAAAEDQPTTTPTTVKSPAKVCKQLRSADKAAFALQFGAKKNAFGKCVSAHAKKSTRKPEAVKAEKNAAKTCKAAYKADKAAFAAEWGTKKNAFGKCVSATAKAKHETTEQPETTEQTAAETHGRGHAKP